jgi:hypothetical protein
MRAEPQATDGWPLRHVPPQREVAWPMKIEIEVDAVIGSA